MLLTVLLGEDWGSGGGGGVCVCGGGGEDEAISKLKGARATLILGCVLPTVPVL